MNVLWKSPKKWLSQMLIFAMLVTAVVPLFGGQNVMAASPVTITEAAGWLESAYVEWTPVSGASGYAVYVKEASQSDSAYVQLDSELIREYSGYWRADAVGLAAGNYKLKVAAVYSDGSVSAVQTSSLTVAAHDRSGFAWVNGTASGAYNENGTLKNNAKVFYVTEKTKDSLVSAIDSYVDGNYPLCVRIIGEITDFSGMDKGDLLIDNGKNTNGLTIEGIGEDATANGWGIRLKNSSNVEIRNIGVMNCDSSEGDNIGLQQANDHIWVHNCDLFYGHAGSDSDQAKGDGALDTKKSLYVTQSYNHFWDSGKCNLQGANKSDTSNYITYHHNWYDHSDSRHPRVRVATVHVYNNFYDGNSKYGIGSTTDSDIFAEANYFRNCRYPMMISEQGTDSLGEGTFSGEVGGMIKAYNNYMEGVESFISYQDNNTSFDAYVATSRTEKVSSSVKAAGGATYNNFDTASDMYNYNVQSPQNAKAMVEKYAGRINGGDFKWEFNDAVEDTNSGVIAELKSALNSYKTSLKSVGGYTGKVDSDVDVPEAETPGVEESSSAVPSSETPSVSPSSEEASETQSSQAPSVTSSVVHNFTTDGLNSNFFTISGNLSTSKGTVTYNSMTLTQCLKMESSTKISFTADADMELTLVFNGENSSDIKVDGIKYTLNDGILTMDLVAGSHTITKAATANLFYIAASYEGEAPSVEESSSEEVSEAPSVEESSSVEQSSEAPSVEESSEVESSTDSSVAAVSYNHNFTNDGLNSNFYTISGNLSTSKGTVTYNGMTLTSCLKMESSTKVSFETTGNAELTLVFNGENSSDIKVDGTKYSLNDGILIMDLAAGSHTITKAATANLFYMSVVTEGNGTVEKPSEEESSEIESSSETESSSEEDSSEETTTPPSTEGDSTTGSVKVKTAGGWNETLFIELSGASDSDVKSVSYTGTMSGTLSGDDFTYLVRDYDGGVRVDIPGLKPGTYSVTVSTNNGNVTKGGITVAAQDRSGYAHFNYTSGVGAYNDNGTLKDNAIVLYVTDSNKNSVSVTSKDGTKVTGIGNILNSAGKDTGSGTTSKGGKPNTNAEIIRKLAEDGTPLVVRIIGNVTAPSGVTEYDSVNYGGSVGDNGYMARMQDGLNITIEGIGEDAKINGWGIHFISTSAHPDFGKSFEVRNISFVNVPEDCIGMEGVQTGSELTASVERCWIHHCSFYAPKISNPAESDKDGGDGACDFKRGQYFTNSYCYYDGYHKTNLVGASDSNVQYHLTYHHNYWKNCESRGPLARQANIHMYNNVFEGQSSYCMNPRANAYIFSEYNIFENSKNPMQIKKGAIKSFNDTFTNCKGDQDGTIVSSKSQKVSSDNKYASFELDSSLCYVASGNYLLHTNTSTLKNTIVAGAGTMK